MGYPSDAEFEEAHRLRQPPRAKKWRKARRRKLKAVAPVEAFPPQVPGWLVWCLMRDRSVVLRATCTQAALADKYATWARREPKVLRAMVEETRFNHLYLGAHTHEMQLANQRALKAALAQARRDKQVRDLERALGVKATTTEAKLRDNDDVPKFLKRFAEAQRRTGKSKLVLG